MSPEQQTKTGLAPAQMWNADGVFKLFAEPVRRKLLLALAREPCQAPSQLRDKVQRSLDGTMKRLASMRSEGFIVMKADTVDVRRRLCSLAPGMPLLSTDKGKVLDFGFLKVPLIGSVDPSAQVGESSWTPDLVYTVLSEPERRKIIAALARTPGVSAAEFKGPEYHLHCTLKRIAVLRAAGFVVSISDSADGRRQLYSLAANLPLVRNESGVFLDFGFCTVKLL